MMSRALLLMMLTCCVLKSFPQAKQFKIGDERRRYLIYIPKTYSEDTTRKFPLILNFHGGGMTMTEHMFYSGMNKTAEKYNFIVVYPQGLNQDWNVGFETSYQSGTNDVGYIDKLLEFLILQYRIDERSVYATGLSRGGFFCQRLAAELPEKFAAIAPVGAPLPDSVAYFHFKKIPVSVMLVHGTNDPIVNYNGKTGAYKSATETFNYWKKHNGMELAEEKEIKIDKIKSDSTAIKVVETTKNGKAISLVTIINGGHTLPGADPFNIGFPLGLTTKEIDANEIIWKFFSSIKQRKID